MNTTEPLNKILFLLDEISQCKQRLAMATNVGRDIEIALLQSKIIALYGEIQHYNQQAMQPQQAVNQTETKHQPIINKAQEKPQNTFINTEEKPNPQTFSKPVSEQENKPENKAENTFKPQVQAATTASKTTDFEKKREKLLQDESEIESSPAANNSQVQNQPAQNQLAQNQVIENKKPEIEKEAPKEVKTEAPTSIKPEESAPAENKNIENKPAEQPAKQNVSQLYAQARERAANPNGNEKSLNEKLATQQTSLNDKFQSNVKKNLADKLKLSPISDLRTAININQRVAFINKLFKGDDKEFKNVVGTVNNFKNFSEAKFYLNSDIAPRYGWNDENADVQDFMELVYRKFL